MAAPFEFKFLVSMGDAISQIRSLTDGVAQTAKGATELAQQARGVTEGLSAISEAAGRNAETLAAVATASQAAISAEQAEAAELSRLTELLGSEANARASLASRIIDQTAVTVLSEEEAAATIERRNTIMAESRQRMAERMAAQQEAAAATTASAVQEVAAAEAVQAAQIGETSLATQAALAKQAASEAASNLAVQIEDLAQAQKNLAGIEAAEPENTARINRARQELAAETQRVADAEVLAARAKQVSAEASDRLAQAEKRAADAARTGTFSGRAQELGQLLTTLGLIDPPLLRLGVGFQTAGTMAETLAPKIAAAGGGVAGFVTALGPMIVAGTAVAGVLYAVAEAASFVKEAIAAAIPQQSSETTFAVLLGNTEAARQRLEELDETATKFRLDPTGVRAASEELTRLSQGALGSGKSLETVIEVSARTGQSLSSAGALIGRLYETIQSGAPVGRMAQQLVRLGIVSQSDINHLNNLSKSGASASTIWEAAEAAIGRYSGAAGARANTFEGAVQGIKGAWEQLLVAFGRPVVDALTPALLRVGDLLTNLKPVASVAGAAFGTFAQTALDSLGTVTSFINGDFAGAASHLAGLVVTAAPILDNSLSLIGHLVKASFLGLKADILGIGDFVVQRMAAIFDSVLSLAGSFVKSLSGVLAKLPGGGGIKDSVGGAVDGVLKDAKTGLDVLTKGSADLANKARSDALDQLAGGAADVIKIGLGLVAGAGTPPAPNDGTKFKPVTPGSMVPPDAKGGRASTGRDPALAERQQELQALSAAEKAYQDTLRLTDAQLALGAITPAQAEEQNIATTQAYITKLQALRTSLSQLKDQGPKTQEAMVRVNTELAKSELFKAQQTPLGNIRVQLTQLANGWTDMAKVAGNTAREIATNITGGISNALTGLITGTRNWGQAFAEVGKSIISTLVQIVVQYTVGRALISAINAIAGSGESSSADAQASSAAAAWAPAATSASIASYGTAAGVGLAAYLGALGAGTAAAAGASAIGGYRSGGYTGDGHENEVAGVVHRGEYVFPKSSVLNWGVENLRALSQAKMTVRVPRLSSDVHEAMAAANGARGSSSGYSPTGRASGSRRRQQQQQSEIHIHLHGTEEMAHRAAKSYKGRQIFRDLLRQHAVVTDRDFD